MKIINVPYVTALDVLFVESHGNYKRTENWGDIYKVRRVIFYMLQFWRETLGVAIHLNIVAAINGHSTNSLHYDGLAADLYIADYTLYRQALAAINMGFTGIGVYPWWNTPGLHVDRRDMKGKPSVYWISPKEGEYNYFSNVSDFLKQLEMIAES